MKGFLKNGGIFFDTKPTKGSNNAVISNGIFEAIKEGSYDDTELRDRITQAESDIETIESSIPTNASSSNKLITIADLPYSLDSSISVQSIEEVGPSLVALGVGNRSGRLRVSGSWYDYIATILGDITTGGLWLGNVLLWGDNGNLYTLRKGYSTSTVWIVSQFQKVQ